MGKRKLLKNNGITLVALIATIIVLLILVGVSIAMLTGENGILTQAQKSKEETEQAKKDEISGLDNMESLINEYTGDVNIPQVTDENPGKLEKENETTSVINSIEDLVFFSYDVTINGNTYKEQTVKLGVNLDFKSDKSYVDPNRTDYGIYGYDGNLKQLLTTEEGFIPIGNQDEDNEICEFYGVFEGNNNKICSLYQNMNEKALGGFFSVNYGEIRNLGLVNVSITAVAQKGKQASVGGIARINNNKISNCYITGSIRTEGSSWMPIGGICALFKKSGSSIENCCNFANIECKNVQKEEGYSNINCGGILGQTGYEANINKCFNKGNIIIDGGVNAINIGGICGFFSTSGIIKNSYNNAQVKCVSENFAVEGGIVGDVGYSGGDVNIENCYNIGEINGNANRLAIGGIIGQQWKKVLINNIYNTGKIVMKSKVDLYGGGILGIVQSGDKSINNAYNIGILNIQNETEDAYVGSIIGTTQTTLNNCCYLKGTYDVGVGGSGLSTGVIELDSIDDFKSVLEVVNGEGVFKEDVNNINNGYPILNWQ